MIKTMLLTAQLALSPIVGTNGLQPKRLPNPVYGETIDYSVTYNGTTYTRYGYNNLEQKILGTRNSEAEGRNGVALTIGTGENQDVWITSGEYNGNAKYSNVGNGDPIAGITWFDNALEDFSWPTGNVCVSFYIEADDGHINYFELFNSPTLNYGHVIFYDPQKNYTDEDEGSMQSILTSYGKISANYNIYFYEWAVFNPPQGSRLIPAVQPTTNNPSLYDNIYSFYYDNLFANEALDELGAKVGNNAMTMRQWLAHTATIISISLLSTALVILVIKIFKLIAGSISDIWG